MTQAKAIRRFLCLGILLPLLGCGGAASEPDQVEITPVDVVRFTPGDAKTDTAPATDSGIPDGIDLASETGAPLEETGSADASVKPDAPEGPDVPLPHDTLDNPDLADATEPDSVGPPDIQLPDTGTVDAGPCGQCPASTPMCQNGACVCTGQSCPGGFYCKGGSCSACTDDIHCGPLCESCASMGMYCQYDGSKCVICDTNHPCPPGNKCIDGTCKSCEGLGLCGPECIQCLPATPLCVNGVCECSGQSCGDEALCEGGKCIPCTDNDPKHCGAGCLVCEAPNPHCDGGVCTFCNVDDACGPTCAACGGATPFCPPDGTGCVECLEDPDCAVGFKCKSFVCIADCKAQGCQSNLSPSGEKCSQAWVVGRLDAKKTFTKTGDTWSANDDDDLNYFFGKSECWDASSDNFFRIYLMAGDQIAVTAAPAAAEWDFDLMLKLYTGTECDDDSAGIFDANDKYLIQCWDDELDGDPEGFSYTATAEGWYTVVVDGRLAGTEDLDYGEYSFSLTLTCSEDTCCCE